MDFNFSFRSIIILIGFLFTISFTRAQVDDEIILDYTNPQTYRLADLSVKGGGNINEKIVKAFTGLKEGELIKVPGEELSNAIDKLWEQNLFSDVQIRVVKLEGKNIFLRIDLKTRPRLSKYKIRGVNKSKTNKIREEITLVRGDIITEQLKRNIKARINKFWADKGYLKSSVEITEERDTMFSNNSAILNIDVDKGERIKIKDIVFEGNDEFTDNKLCRIMKNTKKQSLFNILKSSKFIKQDFEQDKQKIIGFYNTKGFRDAEIVRDSVFFVTDNKLQINIEIQKGQRYYFRDIIFTGNTKYKTETLRAILAIEKGDVYNPALLERKLFFNPNGLDISSLYMDNGYLFFNVQPVETSVEADSIDIEIRISEGPQATIDEVTVTGNTTTSDHVILREIRTRPGEKFSRAEIIRSQRELSNLGYFDAEQMEVNPTPNLQDGTVDIEYKVVERPSDQLELQGGYGNGFLVGSLGFSFNNFALNKVFKGPWDPIPSGNGQRLSIRGQTSGFRFSSINFSFTEPWLGGKKPNSFTVSTYYTVQANAPRSNENRGFLETAGINVGLGKRLRIPDDYFTLNNSVGYQRYRISNFGGQFILSDGTANSISFQHTLTRSSKDQLIYPRRGSLFRLGLNWTPPVSAITGEDLSDATGSERYKWVEFHKWTFDANWYLNPLGKFVIAPSLNFGYLGFYNPDIGLAPFERFFVGGSGLQGFRLDGRELVRLRGYADNSLSEQTGSSIYNKYTLELRYPLSLNPQATVYGLAFLEGGNAWTDFREFDPFTIRRAAGAGVRIFLPMFGLLGFDWGYGFDGELPGGRSIGGSQFHLLIGQQF